MMFIYIHVLVASGFSLSSLWLSALRIDSLSTLFFTPMKGLHYLCQNCSTVDLDFHVLRVCSQEIYLLATSLVPGIFVETSSVSHNVFYSGQNCLVLFLPPEDFHVRDMMFSLSFDSAKGFHSFNVC